ncbi:MAG: sugar ABC transporter permease [Anaerolineaceae bacterium]
MKLSNFMRNEMPPSVREALGGYRFVLIWLIGFALFTFFPLIETFRYSVHQVTVTATGIRMVYISWENYTRALFTDPTFMQLVIEYTLEIIISTPIVLIFAMIIALFLNLNFPLKGIFRTIFFLPVVITSGPVISELIDQGVASVPEFANLAAVSELLMALPLYLRNPIQYLLTSFIVIFWFSGVQILIYLASLQKIDHSIYEAAAIDGASAWVSFWKITLPSLSTTTLINGIFTIITLSHFSGNKVISYIFRQTFAVQGGIGYASAMSFIYFAVLMILLAGTFMLLRSGTRR